MDGISESEVPFLFFKAADRVQGFLHQNVGFSALVLYCCGIIVLPHNTNSNTEIAMDVTWLVDEYLGNGKVRHAAFSSKRRAVEVAERSCDHSSKVILVEWTYCRPLSVQQLFPVRTDPVVYESSSVYAIS